MNEGRDKFLQILQEGRKGRFKRTVEAWSKLPPNIRAAIAKVAGVENVRLDAMTAKDREAMYKAAKKLVNQLEAARVILISAQFPD